MVGGANGSFPRIGMRIFAVGDQGGGVPGHTFADIRMRIEHGEKQQFLRSGQQADSLQQVSLGVGLVFRSHGSVQNQKNRLNSTAECGLQVFE